MIQHGLEARVVDWIERSVGRGARVGGSQRLPGSTSAELHLVEVEQAGRPLRLVVRLFILRDWLEREPDLARHEAAALERATQVDEATPELVAFEEAGDLCGVPAILMTELPGRVELCPADQDAWLVALADALHAIHAVPGEDFGWVYRSWVDVASLQIPGWTDRPELWERVVEVVQATNPDEPSTNVCFLHRDYHATNVLWRGNQISGVVDWVNACTGPAAVDVAHCRRDLWMMRGIPAADRFLAAYAERASSAFHYDPYWDLAMVADLLPDPVLYPPWREFGLDVATSQAERRQCLEAVAARALAAR